MISHGCKGKEPIPPRFIKIILQKTLEAQKLMIPVKFVKNHGENLQNQATLKVPGDSTWNIKLGKCNGKLWMERGWKEFSDYYSLAHGHFLVFEYRGNSVFYVFIFDHTATEIDYPLSNRRKAADHELPRQDAEDSDDESVKILESCSFFRKKTERSPPTSLNLRNTMKTDPTSKASSELLRQDVEVSDDESVKILERCSFFTKKRERSPLPSPNPRMIMKTDPTSKDSGANCRPSISQAERGKGSVGKFVKGSSSSGVPATTPYPFFKVVMRCSCFDPHVLSVPVSFTRKYIKHEKQKMQLQVGDGSWLVALNYDPGRRSSRLSAGWMAFARGNNLEEGDTCTFELIKRNVLRVSISRKQRHLN